MEKQRKPLALPGDATLAVVAPSFAVDSSRLLLGESQLEERGFSVVWRDDLFERCDYFAGDDARRSSELMEAILDPGVDGILCARGGYGCTRILPDLDPVAIRDARKPLGGYSDITSLLLWQWRRAGLVGFHAPMFDRADGLAPLELEALVRMLTGAETEGGLRGVGVSGGSATGTLIGGSLTLVVGSLGTPWELESEGSILLFEEIGEKPYAIDRMLAQLRAAGKLAGLAGVGVGHLVECVDAKRERPTAREVIEAAIAPLGIPLVFDLPFGHGSPNLPWPFGIRARIDAYAGEVAFLESAVVRRADAGKSV